VGTSKTLGYHNKPIGCGASGAHALGPDEKKKKKIRRARGHKFLEMTRSPKINGNFDTDNQIYVE
jgi:hypothetical protein